MGIILNGDVFKVIDCEFSVIHQEYRLITELYRCMKFWRRESGQIQIIKLKYVIHISKNTPHVIAVMENEGKVEDEIKASAKDYIVYSLEPEDQNLIKGERKTDWTEVVDRLEPEQIWMMLGIQQDDIGKIRLNNAY